jgi:hypothetical protein
VGNREAALDLVKLKRQLPQAFTGGRKNRIAHAWLDQEQVLRLPSPSLLEICGG